MSYIVLADLLVVVHAAFIVFVVFGWLPALRWPRVALIHLPSAVWGALVELAGWICPLTPLEWRLRRLGGAAGYEGTFIEHYLIPLVYPAGLTPRVQVWLGLGVVAINALGYAWLWRRLRTGAP